MHSWNLPWSETRCFKANLSTLHIAFTSICTFDRGGVGINARPHYATSRAYLCDAVQSFLDLRVPFSAPSLPPARNDAAAAGEGQRQNRALKKIHRTNICILVHKGKIDTCWLRCRGSIAQKATLHKTKFSFSNLQVDFSKLPLKGLQNMAMRKNAQKCTKINVNGFREIIFPSFLYHFIE